VTIIAPPGPCKTYMDFGDAPEGVQAYASGVLGHFPTCLAPTAPGTMEQACDDPSMPPPGPTGYVEHVTSATDNAGFWLGCGDPFAPGGGVDSEPDGRSWLIFAAGQIAACDPAATPDCTESAFGLSFGQDECYGDADAGLSSFVTFNACNGGSITTKVYSCAPARVNAFLNVLVDWNEDGDWNDNVRCNPVECAAEWAVQNQPVVLDPGCGFLTSKKFLVGPNPGSAWMRVTLSEQPAPPDFPWNGTAGLPGGAFHRGETEDYPVRIDPSTLGVGDTPQSAVAFAPPAPNPAAHTCAFSFTLPHADEVSLVVYDLAGRERARLAEGQFAPGPHGVTWDFRGSDGQELRAGLYLVRLRAGGLTLTRSVMHVK